MEFQSKIGLISVQSGVLKIDANRIGKLTLGENSREILLSDLIAFKLSKTELAIESSVGVTNIFYNKNQRDDMLVLFEQVRLGAPQAVEGAVSGNLQPSSSVMQNREELTRAREKAAALSSQTNESAEDLKALISLGDSDRKKKAAFEGVVLFDRVIRFEKKEWSLSGAEINLEMGQPRSRMTLTRIGTGAVLFGGVGAIVGGMSKKTKAKGYIEILSDKGGFVIEFDAKKEKEARQFVVALKAASKS